jgi:hypothetical protein
MTAYEYLQKYVVSILKPSHFLSGVGYFAVRDIKKGEPIFEPWYGESGIYSITHEELFSLPDELRKSIYETFTNEFFYRDKNGNPYDIKKEYGKIFFPLEKGFHWIYIWPMFINGGQDKSNVTTTRYDSFANRDIKSGEELLSDYGSKFKFKPKNFI